MVSHRFWLNQANLIRYSYCIMDFISPTQQSTLLQWEKLHSQRFQMTVQTTATATMHIFWMRFRYLIAPCFERFLQVAVVIFIAARIVYRLISSHIHFFAPIFRFPVDSSRLSQQLQVFTAFPCLSRIQLSDNFSLSYWWNVHCQPHGSSQEMRTTRSSSGIKIPAKPPGNSGCNLCEVIFLDFIGTFLDFN